MSHKSTAPLFLTAQAAAQGIALETITAGQLILATARRTKAVLTCYEKTPADIWQIVLSGIPGFVGRGGVLHQKTEGDGGTPAGLYGLGTAFGNNEKPETRMPYRQVTADSTWVDDPKSRHYNTWVEGPESADGSSGERLVDFPKEYAYAVVIEYNTNERIPGRGSAIFLHCGEKPTSGCVAIPEKDMIRLLQWLDPQKRPAILITGIL